MLEKAIVAKVVSTAKALGFWTHKTHGGPFSRGIPDILAIRDGRACWMEVKRPGETPTRLQEHVLRQLAEAGCPVAVVTSAGEARAFLESLK